MSERRIGGRLDRDSGELAAAIDAITSVTDEAGLQRLQLLLDEFFKQSDGARHLDAWFRLFERFPEDDGHGIGSFVVASVQRKSSEFAVLMVNRMINGGVESVDGVRLLSLLEAVAADTSCPASVAKEAASFVEYQRSKA
ncbi:MAG: hypothetical protein ABMA14_25500 [Hyphomonadaceae bacterium]